LVPQETKRKALPTIRREAAERKNRSDPIPPGYSPRETEIETDGRFDRRRGEGEGGRRRRFAHTSFPFGSLRLKRYRIFGSAYNGRLRVKHTTTIFFPPVVKGLAHSFFLRFNPSILLEFFQERRSFFFTARGTEFGLNLAVV
jgi:hypothetical protein